MDINRAFLMFGVNLLLPLVVGYGLRRIGWLSQQLLDRIMNWNLWIGVTALGFISFWNVRLEWSLMWIPFIAVMTMLVPGWMGAKRAKQCYDSPLAQGAYVLSAMISNRNTAGTITVFLLLGEEGYAYSRLFVVLNWLYVLGICYPLAMRYRGSADVEPQPLWKALVNVNQIPLLGIAAGVVINIMGVPRPQPIGDALNWLVPLNMWLFLLPVGYAMRFTEMRQVKQDTVGLIVLKFIVTPLTAYLLGKLAGLNDAALYTCVILAASPTAIQAVVVSRMCGLNQHLASGAFILTMVLFLFAVLPIIVGIFTWFNLFAVVSQGG